MLMYEMLEGFTQKNDSDRALLYMGKSFTYRHLFDAINDAAARLSALVGAGEVATVCMPNTPECVACFYALNRIGAVAHMVHPLTPPAQLKKFMAAAHSKLLITLSINLEKYADIAEQYKVISISPVRSLSPIIKLLFSLKTKKHKGDRTNIIEYDKLPKSSILPRPDRDEKATGVYLHSGGTGGEPKIIELSDYAINSLAGRGLEALCTNSAKGMYMLGALPMFHGFGLAMGIHSILTHGGVSVLMPKFDPDKTVKLIKRNQMHFLIGVPNLYRSLLRRSDFSGDMLKNLYVAYVGGDCAPQDLLDEFNARMESAGARARLFEGYGLTETVTVCAVNNYDHSRRGSMGHMLSELKAIVVDPETLQPLAVGEKGELAISGNTMMNGYLDNPEENARVFFDVNGEKYVRTGDFGYTDGDGYLYFVQRLKRIIKISGISVYPKEIESAALELSGVTGACAVEYKSSGKTRIALFLTGSEHSGEEIKKHIEGQLSRYAVPTLVKYIEAIPVTPVMKADVRALEALALEITGDGHEA